MPRGKTRGRGGRSKPRARGAGRRDPRADRLFGQAMEAHRRGDLPGAARLYQEILSRSPDHAGALCALGGLAARAGDKAQAARLLRHAVRSAPGDPLAWNNLGAVLKEQGRLHEALGAYRSALALRPGYATAMYNLGLTLQALGESARAVAAFESLVELTPGDHDAWNKLGGARLDHGDLPGAMRAHEQALRLRPGDPHALNGLGLVCMDEGDFESAAAHYRRAIDIAPGFSKPYLNLAKTRRFGGEDAADLERIRRARERQGWADDEAADLEFALGKVLDDLADYPQAFACYARANRLRRRQLPVDREGFRRAIDELVRAFGPALLARAGPLGDPSPQPVLIVGMPRSGTTLVEQIVSSHPRVHGGGELSKLHEIATGLPGAIGTDLPYPRCVVDLAPGTGRRLAREYLDYQKSLAPAALRITDKMPRNYLHLGLAALLLPGAQVIECARDPMDVCLSVYFHQFAAPYPLGYDLADIAFDFRQYRRLMAHWKEVLPLKIHTVRYEALVDDPEPVARELIAHCGLEWDEACLRFHQTRRAVHTASNWQVRQPVYRRSVARWRHYEPFLGELRAALEGDEEPPPGDGQ